MIFFKTKEQKEAEGKKANKAMEDFWRKTPKSWCGNYQGHCTIENGYHESEIEFDGDKPIEKITCHLKRKYIFFPYEEVTKKST